MKIIKNATTALVSIAAVVAMTACSSDGDSGGGGGATAPLATGGFVKEVAKGTTDSWYNLPFSTAQMKSQHLVFATDIKGSGYIESFTFRSLNTAIATNCPNITIKMGHTSVNALSTTFALNVEEGKGSLQTVIDGALAIPAVAAGDFFTITLDEPFSYNGVDNLIMDFTTNEGCSNGISLMTDYSLHVQSIMYVLSTSSATGAVYDVTPNVQLNFAGGDDKINLDGVDTGFLYPFTANPAVQKIQMLYTSSEINGTGPITGFAYKVGQTTTVDQEQTITVRMGHTTKTAIADGDTFADNFTNSVEVITDANFTVPANIAVGDYVWLPTTGSFNYNGTDNLIVEVDVTVAAATEEFIPASNTVDVTGRRICGASGGTVADGGCSPDALYIAKFRFNGATTDVITDGGAPTSFIFHTSNPTRQVLYRAAELGTAGTISKVACRMSNTASIETEYANYLVTMGHTTFDQLTATFADNFDDATVVYDGNYTVPAGLVQGDWIEIPITPFSYDGIRNLSIQFASDGGSISHSCYMSSVDAIKYPIQTIQNSDRTAITASNLQDYKADIRLWIAP